MSDDSVADDELAAFVDRILRMKAEEDAIKSDIKEIYAEAKGRGYDKTRLGEVVAHVRKVEKDASGEAEKEAIRDLYLTAYFRAKNKPHAHAYARGGRESRSKRRLSEAMADNIEFSAELAADGLISEEAHAENIALSDAVAAKLGAGVIRTTEPQSAPPAVQMHADHAPVDAKVSLQTSLAGAEGIADQQPNPEAKASEDGGTTVQHIGSADDSVTGDVSRASVSAGSDAFIQPETASAVPSMEGIKAPLMVADHANAGGGNEAVALTANSIDHVLNDAGKPVEAAASAAPGKFNATALRPHCKQPYACGGQGKLHCFKCRKAAGLEDAA